MNEKPETTAIPETGSAAKASETAEDGPSTSAASAATITQPAVEGPSFLERIGRLFRQRNGGNIREEIADALAESGADTDSFSPGERAMLGNILRLREVTVEDVMVPRADIQAIEITTNLSDLLAMFQDSGHSRMPVYAGSLDDPRGMVHIRDVLVHITSAARIGVKPPGEGAGALLDLSRVDLSQSIETLGLIRNVLFVPSAMLASELMTRMQATRTQMALVIDEYGGTDGVVSLEDIVEVVVGDIEDEHDEDVPLITHAGDGVFIIDGKAEIEDVAPMISDDFKPGEHLEYVDTIGGMVLNAFGRVPLRGEVIQAVPGFEFHVLDADPRRVKRVRIVDLSKVEEHRREPKVAQG
ncbi:hemolysin family protein [Oryzicola mucosus]|uniref:HlyC/CorC family transporter n=1 Tax=Oryzicola mucosus TaxID=2767425 RepID=A0A8J6PVE3_9HYPH|nr:hemolysin family protein [Oryzicola mucosus]MBD0414917.1 HlyC/CorC family transporter [Oryzicola mucosus]